jgi:hypothetical protein
MHVFHRILDRYLDGAQYAFETTSRELWPEPRPSWHPLAERATGDPGRAQGRRNRIHRELEPQS